MFCLSVKMFIFTIVMKSLELNMILSFEIISYMNFFIVISFEHFEIWHLTFNEIRFPLKLKY